MGFFSYRQKRRNQMQETAIKLGMEFHMRDEYGLLNLLKDFKLFGQGHGRRITNILSHRRTLEQPDIRVFDYRFAIDKAVFRQTVFYIHSKELNLPKLLVKPEHFFHQIGEYFGMQDIDFELFPVFSDNYLVQGDEVMVRHALNDDVLRYFTVEKNWSLEGMNYLLVFYRKKKRIQPEQIEEFYRKGLEVYEMLRLKENQK